MVSGRTVIHALVGAIVGIVLSFIPFSTVIGGAVAGFLEGPDGRNGAAIGALSGAIAFLPIAGLFLLVLAILGIGLGAAAVPLEGFAFVAFAMAMVSMIVLLYTVGLSLVGGYLGAYLAQKYPDHHASMHRSIGGGRREPLERGRPRADRRDRREPWESPGTGDRRTRRDARERREPRDDPSRDSSDTFRPDPHERLDPTRWQEGRDSSSDADLDSERERERGLDSEREPERKRERERDRE